MISSQSRRTKQLKNSITIVKASQMSSQLICREMGQFRRNAPGGMSRASEKNFQGVRRSIPGPQILLGHPSLIGVHAVKSFFVGWV